MCTYIYIHIYTERERDVYISSISDKCRTPAGLSICSWGCGLPALGCPCKALPNTEKVPRPTGVWQKGFLELIVPSDDQADVALEAVRAEVAGEVEDLLGGTTCLTLLL